MKKSYSKKTDWSEWETKTNNAIKRRLKEMREYNKKNKGF